MLCSALLCSALVSGSALLCDIHCLGQCGLLRCPFPSSLGCFWVPLRVLTALFGRPMRNQRGARTRVNEMSLDPIPPVGPEEAVLRKR